MKKKVVAFINMPKYLHILLVSSDQLDMFELQAQQKVPLLENVALNSSGDLVSIDNLTAVAFSSEEAEVFPISQVRKESEKFDFLFGSKGTKTFAQKMMKFIYKTRSHWRGERPLQPTEKSLASSCVCVSRGDKVIDFSGRSLFLLIANELSRCHFGSYLLVVLALLSQRGNSSIRFWAVIWTATFIYYLYLIYRDEEEKVLLGRQTIGEAEGAERVGRGRQDRYVLTDADYCTVFSANRSTESVLREFCGNPLLSYEDNYHYAPVASSRTLSSEMALSTHSNTNRVSFGGVGGAVEPSASAAVLVTSLEGNDIFPAGPVEESSELKRQKEMFEAFSFPDISEGERQFSVDKRFSHTFQVRSSLDP